MTTEKSADGGFRPRIRLKQGESRVGYADEGVRLCFNEESKKRKSCAKAMAERGGCGIATVLAADTDVEVSVVSAAVLDRLCQSEEEPPLENSEGGSLYKT